MHRDHWPRLYRMSAIPNLTVAHLTPPGRGAVATLVVEGPGAARLVRSLLHPQPQPPAEDAVGRLTVGRFGSEPGEQVVVRCRSEESVELHCHGGLAAAAMIQQTLVGHGCRVATWQQWVAGRAATTIASEAQVALAAAPTQRTAAILLDQYHGALERALEEIEAAVARGDTAFARQQAGIVLARADLGRHLTRPWDVVLAGAANVGKSSLINALVGYRRVIVHDSPGTTRDVVTVVTAIDGWPVALSDTAGFGASGDPLAEAASAAARQKLSAADLIVLVFDGGVPWSRADQAFLDTWPGGIVVHTKSDLPRPPGPRPPGLAVSSLTGEGIDLLLEAISHRLVADPPPPGAAVPLADHHIQRISSVTHSG